MAIEFCGVDSGRKHRVHQWINAETTEPLFGIQANLAYGRWAHVVVPSADGAKRTPLIFQTKQEAQQWIKALSTTP